eukprot:38656_1
MTNCQHPDNAELFEALDGVYAETLSRNMSQFVQHAFLAISNWVEESNISLITNFRTTRDALDARPIPHVGNGTKGYLMKFLREKADHPTYTTQQYITEVVASLSNSINNRAHADAQEILQHNNNGNHNINGVNEHNMIENDPENINANQLSSNQYYFENETFLHIKTKSKGCCIVLILCLMQAENNGIPYPMIQFVYFCLQKNYSDALVDQLFWLQIGQEMNLLGN